MQPCEAAVFRPIKLDWKKAEKILLAKSRRGT